MPFLNYFKATMDTPPSIRGIAAQLGIWTSENKKYLALYILEIKESGLVRSLHACLASMAKLKAWRFRKPIPPWILDLHIFFQATQASFCSWCHCLHQKLHIMLSRSSHRPFGRRKQLIVYVGTAWAIALIRISLPPIESIFFLSIPKAYFPLSLLFPQKPHSWTFQWWMGDQGTWSA